MDNKKRETASSNLIISRQSEEIHKPLNINNPIKPRLQNNPYSISNPRKIEKKTPVRKSGRTSGRLSEKKGGQQPYYMGLLQEKNLQIHPKQMSMLEQQNVQQMLDDNQDLLTDAVLLKASAVQQQIKSSAKLNYEVKSIIQNSNFQDELKEEIAKQIAKEITENIQVTYPTHNAINQNEEGNANHQQFIQPKIGFKSNINSKKKKLVNLNRGTFSSNMKSFIGQKEQGQLTESKINKLQLIQKQRPKTSLTAQKTKKVVSKITQLSPFRPMLPTYQYNKSQIPQVYRNNNSKSKLVSSHTTSKSKIDLKTEELNEKMQEIQMYNVYQINKNDERNHQISEDDIIASSQPPNSPGVAPTVVAPPRERRSSVNPYIERDRQINMSQVIQRVIQKDEEYKIPDSLLKHMKNKQSQIIEEEQFEHSILITPTKEMKEEIEDPVTPNVYANKGNTRNVYQNLTNDKQLKKSNTFNEQDQVKRSNNFTSPKRNRQINISPKLQVNNFTKQHFNQQSQKYLKELNKKYISGSGKIDSYRKNINNSEKVSRLEQNSEQKVIKNKKMEVLDTFNQYKSKIQRCGSSGAMNRNPSNMYFQRNESSSSPSRIQGLANKYNVLTPKLQESSKFKTDNQMKEKDLPVSSPKILSMKVNQVLPTTLQLDKPRRSRGERSGGTSRPQSQQRMQEVPQSNIQNTRCKSALDNLIDENDDDKPQTAFENLINGRLSQKSKQVTERQESAKQLQEQSETKKTPASRNYNLKQSKVKLPLHYSFIEPSEKLKKYDHQKLVKKNALVTDNAKRRAQKISKVISELKQPILQAMLPIMNFDIIQKPKQNFSDKEIKKLRLELKQISQKLHQVHFREIDAVNKPQRHMFFCASLFKIIYELYIKVKQLIDEFKNNNNQKKTNNLNLNDDLGMLSPRNSEEEIDYQLKSKMQQKYFLQAEMELRRVNCLLPVEQVGKNSGLYEKEILNEWNSILKPFLASNNIQFIQNIHDFSKLIKKMIELSSGDDEDIQCIQSFAQKVIMMYQGHFQLTLNCQKHNNLFAKMLQIVYLSSQYIYQKCNKEQIGLQSKDTSLCIENSNVEDETPIVTVGDIEYKNIQNEQPEIIRQSPKPANKEIQVIKSSLIRNTEQKVFEYAKDLKPQPFPTPPIKYEHSEPFLIESSFKINLMTVGYGSNSLSNSNYDSEKSIKNLHSDSTQKANYESIEEESKSHLKIQTPDKEQEQESPEKEDESCNNSISSDEPPNTTLQESIFNVPKESFEQQITIIYTDEGKTVEKHNTEHSHSIFNIPKESYELQNTLVDEEQDSTFERQSSRKSDIVEAVGETTNIKLNHLSEKKNQNIITPPTQSKPILMSQIKLTFAEEEKEDVNSEKLSEDSPPEPIDTQPIPIKVYDKVVQDHQTSEREKPKPISNISLRVRPKSTQSLHTKRPSQNPYLNMSSVKHEQEENKEELIEMPQPILNAKIPTKQEVKPSQLSFTIASKEETNSIPLQYGLYNPENGIVVYSVDQELQEEDYFKIVPMKIYAKMEQKSPNLKSEKQSPPGSGSSKKNAPGSGSSKKNGVNVIQRGRGKRQQPAGVSKFIGQTNKTVSDISQLNDSISEKIGDTTNPYSNSRPKSRVQIEQLRETIENRRKLQR